MKQKKSPPPVDVNENVSTLIETLHETDQRLQELTAGEVDAVANRDGRTLLLRRAQDQLRYRETAKQAAILNALPAHIALLDTRGLIISVNKSWRSFVRTKAIQGPGYGIGSNYLEICDNAPVNDSSGARQVAAGIRSVLEGRVKRFSIECSFHLPTEQRWFSVMVTPLAGNPPHGAVVMHLDITEHRAQAQKISRLSRIHAVVSGINAAIVRIRDRRELFQEACRIIVGQGGFTLGWIAVLNCATGKLMPVAQTGRLEDSSAGSTLFTGSAELVPEGAAEVALRDQHSAVDNNMQAVPAAMHAEQELSTFIVRRAAMELGARSVIVLPLIVEKATFGILTLYAPEEGFFDDQEIKLLNQLAGDISFGLEFIAKDEKVDYLAYYDVLTGLANRRLFLERMAPYMRAAVSGGHKLALLFIDLERFKNINDSLGQSAGDVMLRQVSDWLTHSIGDANLLARAGADHFMAVLPEVNDEVQVGLFIQKKLESFLEHPFRLNDGVFRIAFKCGVALFPEHGLDAEALFKHAEAALKQAKARGTPYLFYTEKMTEAVAGKPTLENQLRQALDRGEFVLYYQPKVNLVSGKVTSAEALIRWNDPRTGLVAPGLFIPLLEETGLIHDVGRWALRTAIDDYLRWRAAGMTAVRIAVNVSPLQLRHRGFIAEITQAIGIDAHAAAGLELEITENLIMEDIRHSISTLQEIRAMGVGIAIDDFGTGFSSLSYLSKLPVDTLKIDRSFVIDINVAPQGLALVTTIINLAHALKLKVVAEGVETEEQSDVLQLLDCDEMQGFWFSKPVPVDIFENKFLAAALTG